MLPSLFILLLVTSSVSTSSCTPSITSEDILSIHNTLNTYPLAIDAKNFTLLCSVFTPDAIADYSSGIGVLNGIAAIETALEKSLAPVSTQHALTTLHISSIPCCNNNNETDSSVNTTTYYTATHFRRNATGVVGTGDVLYAYGKYMDTLVRLPLATAGRNVDAYDEECTRRREWRIRFRRLVYMGPLVGDVSVFDA